jgi:hypothetical protein
MKPYSFAAIILRFIAIYLFVAGLLTSLGPLFVSTLFSNTSSTSFSGAAAESTSFFAGLYGMQMGIGVALVGGGIFLYGWSRFLGKVFASGLE